MVDLDFERLLEGVPVHDRADLLSRMCDDEEMASMVMNVFLEDMPNQLEELSRAFGAGDLDAIRRQAHTIKGAASNVGASAMRVVAFELEKAAMAKEPLESLAPLRTRLAAELSRLQAAF